MKFRYILDRPWPHFNGVPDGLITDYIDDITDKEIKERYSGLTGLVKRCLGAFRLYKKPVKDKAEIYSKVMSAFCDAVTDTSEVELWNYNGADCFSVEAKDSNMAYEKFQKFNTVLDKKLSDILSIDDNKDFHYEMNIMGYDSGNVKTAWYNPSPFKKPTL